MCTPRSSQLGRGSEHFVFRQADTNVTGARQWRNLAAFAVRTLAREQTSRPSGFPLASFFDVVIRFLLVPGRSPSPEGCLNASRWWPAMQASRASSHGRRFPLDAQVRVCWSVRPRQYSELRPESRMNGHGHSMAGGGREKSELPFCVQCPVRRVESEAGGCVEFEREGIQGRRETGTSRFHIGFLESPELGEPLETIDAVPHIEIRNLMCRKAAADNVIRYGGTERFHVNPDVHVDGRNARDKPVGVSNIELRPEAGAS